MAEIDYAFIADYAKVEVTGALTVVNGSWMFLQVPVFPTAQRLSIAGRIRSTIDAGAVHTRVVVTGPDGLYRMAVDGEIGPGPAAEPYADGRVGLLFAVDLEVPVPVPGLYMIDVVLPENAMTRHLAFEARPAPVT